jgi:hypothetical protein
MGTRYGLDESVVVDGVVECVVEVAVAAGTRYGLDESVVVDGVVECVVEVAVAAVAAGISIFLSVAV